MRFSSILAIVGAAVTAGAYADIKIDDLVHQAWKQVESAPKTSARDTAARWAEKLWQYRDRATDKPARALATAEALQLLAYAGNYDQLRQKADTLAPEDDAWQQGIQALFIASSKEKNYDYLISKARAVLDSTAERKTKAAVALALGDAYWRDGDVEETRQAFQLALLHGNGGEVAARAQGNLYELAALSTGLQAPPVDLTTLDGERLSTAQLRDKVVLWSFWATWCSACRADIPLLKQLDREFRGRGLVIVGVALDEDPSVLQRFVREQELSWPQVQDGKGGALARLFNVAGPPTKWLVGRESRIIGKQSEDDKLRGAIEEAVNKNGGKSPDSSDAVREQSQRLNEIFEALAVKPGSRVADIGAGSGFATGRLARAVGPQGRVWAVDVDEKRAIPQLMKLVRTEGLSNIEVVHGSADDPKLPKGTLDAVLMMNAYHEMARYSEMLARVAEALKPGGRLVIVDNLPRRTRNSPRADQTKNHVLAPELAENDLRAAGFLIVWRQDDFSAPNHDSEESRWLIVAERP